MAMEGYKALKYKLNPVYFDISSDDRVKMREFVPQRKVQRSIDNLQRINEKYAVVNDFLPRWATEKYLCSLYEELTSQEARNSPTMSPEPEQIKNYIHDIIAFAKEVLQKEEAASSKISDFRLSSDCDKWFTKKKQTMASIHEELLMTFKKNANSVRDGDFEEIKAKNEHVHVEHEDPKGIPTVKKEAVDDESFVPRRLFLFNVDSLRQISQSEVVTKDKECQTPDSSTSSESFGKELAEEEVAPSPKRKQSFRRRLFKFLGIR